MWNSSCGWQNNSSPQINVCPNYWTYECVIWCGKGGFPDVIVLKILYWGDYQETQSEGPCKKGMKVKEMWQAEEVEVTWGHEPRNVAVSKTEKVKEMDSP